MHYDVIVVGAGPAGSMAAKEVAANGKSVLLIEKRKEIGVPVRCGEGISTHWFKEVGLTFSSRAVCRHINAAYFYSPSGKKVVLRDKQSTGIVFDRAVLDKELAAQAARAGAEIKIKTEVVNVSSPCEGKRKVIVRSEGKEETYEGNIIIACDGGESTVSRMVGIDTALSLYDTDVGIEYELVGVPCEDAIELFFDVQRAPRGYFWIFPKGEDVANVGVCIGGHAKGPALSYLHEFLKQDRFRKAQPLAIKGGIIPVCEPIKTFVEDSFMVAGTAAHMVDPIHGGGIAFALEAGMLAGKTAVSCLEKGVWNKVALSEYEKKWRAMHQKRFQKRVLFRKALEQLTNEDLDYIFSFLDAHEINTLSKDKYGIVARIVAQRPSLLKVLSPLLEGILPSKK